MHCWILQLVFPSYSIKHQIYLFHVRKLDTQVFALKHEGNQWLRGENCFSLKYYISVFQTNQIIWKDQVVVKKAHPVRWTSQ